MHPIKQSFSDILKSKHNSVLLRSFTSISHQPSQVVRSSQGCALYSLKTTGLMWEFDCAYDPVQCYNDFSFIQFLLNDKTFYTFIWSIKLKVGNNTCCKVSISR
jgi:hypothetical protein